MQTSEVIRYLAGRINAVSVSEDANTNPDYVGKAIIGYSKAIADLSECTINNLPMHPYLVAIVDLVELIAGEEPSES